MGRAGDLGLRRRRSSRYGIVSALTLLISIEAAAQTPFSATFTDPRGNDWWVEANVSANQTLAGVDARDDGGAWIALNRTNWGSWARSFYVQPGSIIEFRARSTTGATAISVRYSWPTATPVGGAGGGGGGGALQSSTSRCPSKARDCPATSCAQPPATPGVPPLSRSAAALSRKTRMK